MNDEVMPEGVELFDFEDHATARKHIFDGVKEEFSKAFPQSYGGVRLSVENVDYADPEEYSYKDQKEALLKDKFLARRLRGTLILADEKTGEVLDSRDMTLLRVPYLTDRGTFIHGGNEYACFHPSVEVWTELGMIPIGKIVKEKMQVRVWSFDFQSREFVLRKITGWFENLKQHELGYSDFYSDGYLPSIKRGMKNYSTLWGTENHNVYTHDGEKRELGSATSLVIAAECMSYTQRQLIVGTLLGDGHITKRGIYRALHCAKQAEYLNLKAEILKPLLHKMPRDGKITRGGKTYHNRYFHTMTTRELLEMHQAVYEGGTTRTLRSRWYEEADEMALAFWFGDDGHACYQRKTNCPKVVLHTNNFTPEEVQELADWLNTRWNFSFYVDKQHQTNPIADKSRNRVLVTTGASARKFLKLVAPFIPKNLHYKLLQPPTTNTCSICGCAIKRTRKNCDDCYLEKVRKTKGKLPKEIRNRFGGTQRARAAAAYEETLNTAPEAEWKELLLNAGSAVPKMLEDTALLKKLRESPAKYIRNSGKMYSKRMLVYDITVDGTHNYFANGVLVSNSIMQSRLLPGAYTRRQSNGGLETQFNVRTGTGTAFRVGFEPDTSQYRLRVQQANLHLYSLLRDLGVPDEHLAESWGPEILAANQRKYDARVFDKAYARFVSKKEQKPDAPRADKVQQLKAALDAAKIHAGVARRTLPNLFDMTKAATWRKQAARMDLEEEFIKNSSRSFTPDFTPQEMGLEP